MTGRLESLLGLLADGSLHSGAALAAELGVSRTAVWKLVGELRQRGVEIHSLPRRGYRLPRPVELLDANAIHAAAGGIGRLRAEPEILFETGSTNTYLYAEPPPLPGRPRLLLAELQTAGRGRRGRSWLAPFGSGLTFSVAWSFAETPADVPALGLAIGVGVGEALQSLVGGSLRLKWPNDLVWRERKLGGLLLQVRAEAGGGASVVAGLGLNLDLSDAARAQIHDTAGLVVGDLREAARGDLPGRNLLAALLAGAVLDTIAEFEASGFRAFAERWSRLDALAGAMVRVSHGDAFIEGRALGVDTDGALRVDVAGSIERFHSGDVSLRRAATGIAPAPSAAIDASGGSA